MNEEFLRSIYDSKNLGANGATFEDFLKDMQDINFARKIFDSKELGSQGATFDDFITDAGLKLPSPAQEQGGFYNFLGKVPGVGKALQATVDAWERGINKGKDVDEGINAMIGGLSPEEGDAVLGILQRNKASIEKDKSITKKFTDDEEWSLGAAAGAWAEGVVESTAMMTRGLLDAFTDWKTASYITGRAAAGAALFGAKSAAATAATGPGAAVGGGIGATIGAISMAMGANSGLIEASQFYFQELQKELDTRGLSLTKANIFSIANDAEWLSKTRKDAATKGLIIDAFDTAAGVFGAKFGGSTAKLLVDQGLKARAKDFVKTGVKGAAIDAAFGAGGEYVSGQAIGQPTSAKELFLEANPIGPGIITGPLSLLKDNTSIVAAKKARTAAEKTNTPITAEIKENSEKMTGVPGLIDAYKSDDIEQAKTALADLATVHTPEEFSGMLEVQGRIEGLSAEEIQAINGRFVQTYEAAQKFNTPELQQDPERTSRAVKTRLDITQAETAETQLEEQKAAADPSLHPKYDEQIQAVREVKADLEETLGAIVAAPKLEVSDDIGFYRTRLDELETTKTTTKNESSTKTQELLELGAVLQDTISSAISEEYGETVVETPAVVQKVLYDGVEYEVTRVNKDGSFDLSSRDGKFVKAAEKTDAEWQGFVGEPAEATTTSPLPPVKKEKKSSAVTRLEKAAAAIKGSPIAQIESIGALLNITSIPDFVYAKIGDGDISAGKAVVQKAKDLHGEVKAFQSKLAGGKFFSDLDRQIAETRSRIETLEKQETATKPLFTTSVEKRDVLDEITGEKTSEREVTKFSINLPDGARAFGTIDGNTAIIAGINAAKKEGSVTEPVRGSKTFERVISELSKNGVETIRINNQSKDSRAVLGRLVKVGVLTNPRNPVGISVDEHPSTFDIAAQQTSQVQPDVSTTNDTVNEPVSDTESDAVNEGVSDGVNVSPANLAEKSLSLEEYGQFLNTGNVPDSALNTIAERLSWIIDNYMGQISDSENSVVYKLLDRVLPKLSTSLSRLTDEKLKNRILDIQYADRPSNTESTLSRIYEAEIKRREGESNLAEETPPVETQKKLEDLAKEVTMKASTASDLYLINRRIWGLTHEQAIETAVIQDRLVAEMARRAGISKTEIYKSLPFTKNPTSIPGNALYQIIGESAKLARQVLTNLGLAQSQEKLGRTSSYIHNLFGWERGADGRWRYKINFGKLTLTLESLAAMPKNLDGNPVTTLGEIYDAPELFTAYPQLREVEVVFDKKTPPGNGGYDGSIRLSYDQVAKEYRGTSLMSVLVHEIQHVVQDIEGFAQGVGASTVDDIANYINNAGEVEARAAQKMLGLSPEEIRNARLIDLYDVHPDYQIIQFGSDPLFQKDPGLPARGAMAIQSDGIAVMYALTNPNVSTPVHELVHVFERYLTDAEKQTVLAEFGGNEWTTETSEFFARGFERYLLDGVAPTPELQTTFEKFKKWLTDIYLGIRNSVIDTPISVRMENLYASFLTDKEFHNATEKPRVFSTEDKLRGKINQEELDSLRKTIELSDIPPGQTQHIDDMIQESYEKYVTENPLLEGGIYAREEKLAKDALNGLPMDAPMQLALANVINKLRQAHLRETQNLSISKQQGDKKGLIRSISDKIDAIEDQLDMFTRALYKARSVSGRALGIGSKLIDFNAFDEVNMRAKLGERLGESGKTLSEADKAFIKDLSSKINQEVQDIAALDIKDQEAGTKTKMIIAESQISQMKKSKMAKRTQSVLAAKANLDRILKGNIC